MAQIQSAGKLYVVYATILFALLCRPHAGTTREKEVDVCSLFIVLSSIIIQNTLAVGYNTYLQKSIHSSRTTLGSWLDFYLPSIQTHGST